MGEINALITLRDRKYVHFVVSSIARGGFSGGPVLVAYNESNKKSGTALLGLVTDALVRDHGATETGFMTVLSVEPIYQCLEKNGMLPAVQKMWAMILRSNNPSTGFSGDRQVTRPLPPDTARQANGCIGRGV